MCLENLGFGFGFKLTDLDRIKILKSKIRASRLSTFSTLSTLVPFFISENSLFAILKQSKILVSIHSKTSFRVTQGHHHLVEAVRIQNWRSQAVFEKKIRRL